MHLNVDFIKRHWLIIFILSSFAAAIALLMFLDYFNLENIALFNQKGFFFDYTWKGRMFLLVFLMLFTFETIIFGEKLTPNNQTKNNKKILLATIIALVPIAYIIAINFFGLGQSVLTAGDILRGNYWRTNSIYWNLILDGDWPLTLEYIVFSLSFFASILIAYGKAGLKIFSITLAFIAGISVFYFIDTWFPYGAFWPLQILARPTAASAAGLLKIMGVHFNLTFMPAIDSSPILTSTSGLPFSAIIDWPCAGVHSLLLYSLIILLFFKGTSVSTTRKIAYFAVGATGVFAANVLRVVTYFSIMVNQGLIAAGNFHDTYGELFSAGWIFLYILVVLIIQRFKLVEKTWTKLQKLRNRQRTKKMPINIAYPPTRKTTYAIICNNTAQTSPQSAPFNLNPYKSKVKMWK